MKTAKKAVRQSVSLPSNVAAQVRSLAKNRRVEAENERAINITDLHELRLWIESEPEVPESD